MRRVSGFLKVMILLMIFVATPVEVAGVAYVAHDVIGYWIAAVPIGVLYADRSPSERAIGEEDFAAFRRLSEQLGRSLLRLAQRSA